MVEVRNYWPLSSPARPAFIIAFSVISIISTGGFLMGTIFGVMGGALAITWKP